MSSWSEIKKIKTLKSEVDSLILSESKKENEFTKLLFEWSGHKKMGLIYRSSRDGDLSNNFHQNCDNQGPTIVLCKNDREHIFGGYASISWTGQGGYHSAPNSFLFTLTNIYGLKPTKFQLKNNNDGNSIYHGSQYGAIFGQGHDLYIRNNFINNKVNRNFPYSFQDNLGK